MSCRACGDVGLRWSRRSELEWLVGFFVPLRPFRCNSCYARQWGLRRPVINVGTVGVFLVVLLAVVIIVRERLFLEPEAEDATAAQSAAPEPIAPRTQLEIGFSGEAEPPSAEPPEQADEAPPAAAPTEPRLLEIPSRAAVRGASSRPVAAPEQRAPRVPNAEAPTPGADPRTGSADQVKRSFLGVRPQRTSVGLALVVLTSRPVTAVQQTSLQNPRRWVFDLPGRWQKGSSSRLAINYPGIDAVRVGYHPNKLRIVVDLTSPAIELVAVETVPRGLEIHFRGGS